LVITPNPESLGLRVFGSSWLGLDPPRHVHLFSPSTLRRVAGAAGVPQAKVWTSAANADRYARGSLALGRLARRGLARPPVADALYGAAFQRLALAHHRVRRHTGEECVLEARA
jgi:hypothetical protein